MAGGEGLGMRVRSAAIMYRRGRNVGWVKPASREHALTNDDFNQNDRQSPCENSPVPTHLEASERLRDCVVCRRGRLYSATPASTMESSTIVNAD